ncbi:SdiA-regulated domain-containing protein [Xanthocytophaga flava]|nr:SdiA-regulated domain-containing protein [Xanthocytophaga flavus]
MSFKSEKMLKYKVISLLLSLKVLLCNCHYEKRESGFETGTRNYKVTKIGQLPEIISESSGLATDSIPTVLWTHNDGGSPADIFQVTDKGKLLQKIRLQGIHNHDWEDITNDTQGNIYIGDFGNNNNRRKNLAIFKVNPRHPEKIDSIRFSYEDQTAFPPAPEDRNFDCEAFFWHADSLYLFSKNRGNRIEKMYVLPATAGNHIARIRSTVKIKSMVTAADMNPSGTQMALLTYGKVFVFNIKNPNNFFQEPYECIKLARSQAEALTYINDTDFIISNEQGTMYRVERKKK